MAVTKKDSPRTSIESLRIVLLIVIIVGIMYLAKGLFVAAVVNSDPISRLALIQELEKEQGKAALEWLITKKLVLQEARRREISVSQKEVDNEMKKLEGSLVAQGQSFDQALALQGLSRESFRTRVKISKILQKMFEKDVTVTEQEVDEFIEQNRESISEGADLEKLRPSIKEQLIAQKIDQKGNELIQKLKKEAKIYTFVNY